MKYLPIILLLMMGCTAKEAPRQVQRSSVIINNGTGNDIQVTQLGHMEQWTQVDSTTWKLEIKADDNVGNYPRQYSSALISYDKGGTWQPDTTPKPSTIHP